MPNKKNGGRYVVGRVPMRWMPILLHRFILEAPKGVEVDHADRDPLNNTRRNLRFATRRQNILNRATRRGVSGFRGVVPSGPKWQARIRHNYASLYLGTFPTAEEAAHAYDEAARRLNGPFAQLNFTA